MKVSLLLTLLIFHSQSALAQWTELCNPGGQQSIGYVVDYQVYNNNLCATGFFTSVCGTPAMHVAQWDGSNWSQLGQGLPNPGHAIKVINNELYCAQYMYTNDSNYVYKYNGVIWYAIGNGFKNSNNQNKPTLYDLAEFQGQPVVCGEFKKVGAKTINNVAIWNGTEWDSLSSGLSGLYPGYPILAPHGMGIYNGDLIVCGAFLNAGGVTCNGVARWDGMQWHAMDSGFNNPAYAATVYNGELYVCGEFTQSGSILLNGVAKWNGTKWVSPGFGFTAIAPNYFFIHSLDIANNKLFITGGFDQVITPSDTFNCANICSFDGTTIDTLNGGIPSKELETVIEYDNKIFIGGGDLSSLYTTGLIYFQNLTTAVSETDEISMSIYPNPASEFIHLPQELLHELKSVSLTNLQGIRMETKWNTNKIDIKNLSSGYYFIKISLKNGTIKFQRFFKL